MNALQSEESLYGLVGKPLGHSWSAAYFNAKFDREGIRARYVNFELDSIDRLRPMAASLPSLRGFNVTIPYKEAIIPALDALEGVAAEIGAVNTVRVIRGAAGSLRLIGHNTDVAGFDAAIAPLLRQRQSAPRALVLGTGGASRAVTFALQRRGIAVTQVSRSAGPGVMTYDTLGDADIAAAGVIVNCTPLGMWPDTGTCPRLPYGALHARQVCFDLVYNPAETEFMRRCRLRGATVGGGLPMLHAQAEAAWEIFRHC